MGTDRLAATSAQTITDPAVADLIIEFLAANARDDSVSVDMRQRLQAALASYRPGDRATVRSEVGGDTFVLPLQFVRFGESGAVQPLPLRAAGNLLDGAVFHGEILDMLPLPGDPRRLAILFADSIVTATMSSGRVTSKRSSPFPDNAFGEVRSAFPAGRMVTTAGDGFALLTTNLKTPLVFLPENGRLRPVISSDLVRRPGHPTSWFVREGRALFYARMGGLPPFRSLLPFASGKLVLLDEAGYLHLFMPGVRQPRWSSQRPWGSRFFRLGADRLAVCDGTSRALAGFAVGAEGLRLLGETPPFGGAVKAVTAGSVGARDGFFVAVAPASDGERAVARLRFVPGPELRWRLPVRVAPPRFPDRTQELTFFLPGKDLPESDDREEAVPEIVSRQSYETLFQIDLEQHVQPLLAAAARSDSSRKVWDIRLRRGERFADGHSLTAAAVKQSWERRWRHKYRNPEEQYLIRLVAGATNFLQGTAVTVEGIEVAGDLHLRLLLTRPQRSVSELLAQRVFRVDRQNGTGPPSGTGPFQIAAIRNSANRTVFECRRNARYRGGVPPFAAIKFVRGSGSVVDAMSADAVAGALVRNRRDLDYFRELENFKTSRLPGHRLYFLALNPQDGPLADEVLRRRLAAIFDGEDIAGLVSEAECTGADGLFLTEGLRVKMRMPPRAQAGSRGELRVAFLQGDGVARQIAERVVALAAQAEIRTSPPVPVSAGRLHGVRRRGAYDVLVDSCTPHFATPAFDLLDLLDQGYALGELAGSQVVSDFQRFPERTAEELERRLIEGGVLIPLLRANAYVVLPAGLRNQKLLPGMLDLSRAWVPK